jgi:hypothetical protein
MKYYLVDYHGVGSIIFKVGDTMESIFMWDFETWRGMTLRTCPIEVVRFNKILFSVPVVTYNNFFSRPKDLLDYFHKYYPRESHP